MIETVLRQAAVAERLAGPEGLSAWLLSPPASADSPLVFVQHGLTSRKERHLDLCLRLVGAGFRACALDAPGHGDRRDGVLSRSLENFAAPGFLAALWESVGQTAREMGAMARALGAERFGVVGHSMGGLTALEALRSLPGAAVAVAVGAPLDPEWDAPGSPFPPDEAAACADLHPSRHVASFFPRPLAFLHGEADAAVPLEGLRRFIERLAPHYDPDPARLHVAAFPGVGHDLPPVVADAAVAWIEEHLR